MTTHQEWRVVPSSRGTLVEGPRWIAEAECFQWVDILEHAIFRWNPYRDEAATRRVLDLEFLTTAEPLDAHVSLVASRNTLHRYDWAADTVSLCGQWEFPEGVRFNDSGRSPDGTVYVGTMSMEGERGRGSLYRWDGDDSLTPVLDGVGISNGLAWESPDLGYYVDSMNPELCLVRREADGSLARTPLATFGDSDEPDGITLTPAGHVLVAMWEGRRLVEVAADGDIRGVIELPCESPTSVCVGGRDGELLLVTTALRTQHTEWDGAALVRASGSPD